MKELSLRALAKPFGLESFDAEPFGLELMAERLTTEGLTAERQSPGVVCEPFCHCFQKVALYC